VRILVNAVSRNTSPTGVCRFAANLCLAIQPFGEPVLAVGEWQQEYFQEDLGLASHAVRIEKISIANRSISRNAWYLTGLERLCQQADVDILHASFPIPLSRWRKSILRAGTIHDFYAFDAPENFGKLSALSNRMAFKLFLASVNGITCVSQTTLARCHALFPKESAAFDPIKICNSLSPACPPKVPDWVVPGQPFYLCVAQHRKNKNLVRVLEAFAEARSSLPANAILYLIGEEGPETATLQDCIRQKGISDRVKFQKRLLESEMTWMYENALALVCASLSEGFCLPAIEAARQGCPIVASDIQILNEVAPNGTIFLDPTSVDSIRSAMLEIASRPRPKPTCSPEFLLESASEKYKSFYQNLLATGK
jgi:glycosyltransferase involved in cell wall biosynthesis